MAFKSLHHQTQQLHLHELGLYSCVIIEHHPATITSISKQSVHTTKITTHKHSSIILRKIGQSSEFVKFLFVRHKLKD